jgi:hypothetical protein
MTLANRKEEVLAFVRPFGSLAARGRHIMGGLERRLRWREAQKKIGTAVLAAKQRVESATLAAVRGYKPQFYLGNVDLFVTSDEGHQSHKWRAFARAVREHSLGDFEINDLLLGSHVEVLAASLRNRLRSRFRSCLNIAGMAKEIPAFLGAEGPDSATDPAQQAWNCVLGCPAQMRLQFVEGQFDRVEVRRIGGR